MCAFKQTITYRHYDPYSQKFLSEDPIGFNSRDINLYRYVGNNPLVFKDPSGKILWPIATAIAIVFLPDALKIDGLNMSPDYGKESKSYMDRHQDMIIPGNEIYDDQKFKNDADDIPREPRTEPWNPNFDDISLKIPRACS